jgi:hypothetical protein
MTRSQRANFDLLAVIVKSCETLDPSAQSDYAGVGVAKRPSRSRRSPSLDGNPRFVGDHANIENWLLRGDLCVQATKENSNAQALD